MAKPENTKKSGLKGPKVRDTRAPNEIFNDRFNREATLLSRRFARLAALGRTKRACPTTEDYTKASEWLRESLDSAIDAMGRKLQTGPQAGTRKAGPVSVLAVTQQKPVVAPKQKA